MLQLAKKWHPDANMQQAMHANASISTRMKGATKAMVAMNKLHTFPEGKGCQEDEPIRRLKWGTASLIARAPVTPIVLPIVHQGFQKVLDEIGVGITSQLSSAPKGRIGPKKVDNAAPRQLRLQ